MTTEFGKVKVIRYLNYGVLGTKVWLDWVQGKSKILRPPYNYCKMIRDNLKKEVEVSSRGKKRVMMLFQILSHFQNVFLSISYAPNTVRHWHQWACSLIHSFAQATTVHWMPSMWVFKHSLTVTIKFCHQANLKKKNTPIILTH